MSEVGVGVFIADDVIVKEPHEIPHGETRAVNDPRQIVHPLRRREDQDPCNTRCYFAQHTTLLKNINSRLVEKKGRGWARK